MIFWFSQTVLQQMTQHNLSFTSYVIDEEEPISDEKTIGEVLIHFDPLCDHIIAVGSGTINDISRILSYKLKLAYMILGTAPSMDGFASNVAPLIVKHVKTTYEAQTPYAIIADTTILTEAPMKMISAGIGDIVGKYTCLCDWKMAHLITGEYYCDEIEGIVRKSLETVVEHIDSAKHREQKAIKSIMEALVLSGIAMSFAGNSRPASGSEHHLSHYWEMMFLFQDKKPALHGTKVGISTIAVIKAYELLFAQKIDFDKAKKLAESYSEELWKEQMRSAYGLASDPVIKLEEEIGKNSTQNRLLRLQLMEEHWEKLKAIAGGLPSSEGVGT